MARETSDFKSSPSANRLHIGFFGRRNAGKSSLVNAVTGQKLSIVSEIKGTTTDPVRKAMELLPIGPVLIIDTPGFDDLGTIGSMRVKKTKQILRETDLAILVVDASLGLCEEDSSIMRSFEDQKIPYILVLNKCDLADPDDLALGIPANCVVMRTCTYDGRGINDLKELIGKMGRPFVSEKPILRNIVTPGQTVVFVTPIDSSAPKGRMILPQVQGLRDALDGDCCCLFTQVPQLAGALQNLKEPPALVVTDSQAFESVKDIVPRDIPLTSFSILFARYKGVLRQAVNGAFAASKLKDGNKVLISEGCTHHRQCQDIGTVKLPGWIENFSGSKPDFSFTSGSEFPDNLEEFALIVHCGGCMLNEREMVFRMKQAEAQGIPFTNYGTLIAHINGILERSLEVFHEYDNENGREK